MSHESLYGFPAKPGLNATGAPGVSIDFASGAYKDLLSDEFQGIFTHFYSSPRRKPKRPHVAPAMRKPTAGEIIKPPIDVIIINESISVLAVERRFGSRRSDRHLGCALFALSLVAIFSYTTIADEGILVYEHAK